MINKYMMKPIHRLNENEIEILKRDAEIKSNMILETAHIAYTTDKVIDAIYDKYIELIEAYENDDPEFDVNSEYFTRWNFNEYAEDDEDKFYETDEPDEAHHPVIICFFTPKNIAAVYARTFPRTAYKTGSVFRTYLDNDAIMMGLNTQFALTGNFRQLTQLKQHIAHEVTHLFRSVVAPHTDLNATKKNDLQNKLVRDKKKYDALF